MLYISFCLSYNNPHQLHCFVCLAHLPIILIHMSSFVYLLSDRIYGIKTNMGGNLLLEINHCYKYSGL